ncbi:unnamed protein product [Musa acuminata subsp. malaccensis]|uniref:(wild Malaysian banana) hypothetical protein n=1 Tax=Musa acuminata subsp. malaccensis TaxID=214687 RepID=A0A804L4H4_MUSAM|nr:unnamed protein product [Musa acuminata subsp. malaccensis]
MEQHSGTTFGSHFWLSIRRVCPFKCKCNAFKIDLYFVCYTFSDICLTLINFFLLCIGAFQSYGQFFETGFLFDLCAIQTLLSPGWQLHLCFNFLVNHLVLEISVVQCLSNVSSAVISCCLQETTAAVILPRRNNELGYLIFMFFRILSDLFIFPEKEKRDAIGDRLHSSSEHLQHKR